MKQKLLDRALERDLKETPSISLSYDSQPAKGDFKILDTVFVKSRVASVKKTACPEEASEESPEEIRASSSEEVSEVEEEPCDNTPLSEEKPIPFLILEDYIRELCTEIEKTNQICQETRSKAIVMIQTLNDCTKALPDLSIYFYNLARKILREIYTLRSRTSYKSIFQKLLELSAFISEKSYRSNEHPVSKYHHMQSNNQSTESFEAIKKKFSRKINNLSAKNVGIIGKILKTDPLLTPLVKVYMTLLTHLDSTLFAGKSINSPAIAMEEVCAAKVVQAMRKIFVNIQNELIPVELMARINGIVQRISLDSLLMHGKSGVGVMLYEFLFYLVIYFNKYSEEHYGRTVLNVRMREYDRASPAEISYSKQAEISSSLQVSPPKKRAKSSHKKIQLHLFDNPMKQDLFDKVIVQQKINSRFRDFLKDKIVEEEGSEVIKQETLQVIAKMKRGLIREFARKFHLDEFNFERLNEKAVFLENLDFAHKLIKDPEYVVVPKPMSSFNI